MTKIALVLPYFGKFPNYFNFFLASCAQNETVDFHIFTDQEVAVKANNIIVHPCTFEQFCDKIRACFEFPIPDLTQAHNLCHFKPAYGIALQDILREYDFWGHCDADLIFGDMRLFLTDTLLSKYNRIFTRGHLTLYRNTLKVNTFFMKQAEGIPYYKDVYQSSHLDYLPFFDEWGGSSCLWRALAPDKMYDEILFDDIDWTKKKFISSQKVRFGLDGGKSCFYFRKTKEGLFRGYIDEKSGEVKEEPTLYAHFQKRPFKIETENTEEYLIIPNAFVPARTMSADDCRRISRGGGVYLPALKVYWKNALRKIRKMRG